MTRTVGVEEEFILVDASSPTLRSVGDQVVEQASSDSDGQFEHELKREQAELGTTPHQSIVQLGKELRQRRLELAQAAHARGARLLASATSPVDAEVSTTPNARYEQMTSTFGRMTQSQLTCGMHVHVSIASPEEGVAVLDRIRPWLSVLRALSANSPYLSGEDTGYGSYRSVLWGMWPTAGTPDLFGDVSGYTNARAALVSSGAALDDGMIYFDARLSARYPTVEVRVADVCIELSDAVVLAALIRALVSTAASDWQNLLPIPSVRSELLRAATWHAARWGTERDLVDVANAETVRCWELIDRLVSWVDPALRDTGDSDFVSAGLAEIRRRGTGARVQRHAFAQGGVAAVIDTVASRSLM